MLGRPTFTINPLFVILVINVSFHQFDSNQFLNPIDNASGKTNFLLTKKSLAFVINIFGNRNKLL